MKYKILHSISFKEKFAVIISVTSILAVFLGAIIMYVIFAQKTGAIVEKAKGEVYVMVDDMVLHAIRSDDYKTSIEAATKGAIRLFHNYFWSLEPYEDYINSNHQKAFDMGDTSIRQLRKYLNEEGFYNNIISGRYSTRVEVNPEDITIDFTQKPYKFRVEGKLIVIKENETVIHKLWTRGEIAQRGNSDNNFTGFFITRYKVDDFEKIETIK